MEHQPDIGAQPQSGSDLGTDSVEDQIRGGRPDGGLDEEASRLRIRGRFFGGDTSLRIDRYILSRRLGEGGMGTVWLGWDSELRRDVALKFLRAEFQARGEQFLFREAQALARLSHANVVHVYDVGKHDGRVWIAMEYVPGQTLRDWQRDCSPTPAEMLEAWLAVGRGLAAVHAANLIHRDVKPDNVLRGDDGRVRLIDFGLVHAVLEREAKTISSERGRSDATQSEPTLTDGFAGTRAYAAPEQLAGRATDPAADQYAFAVSVWEALCSERPTPPKFVPPANKHMPARVLRALARAMAEDPRDRFASMPELLAALEPRRRRWTLPSLLGTAALAGSMGYLLGPEQTPDPSTCSQADDIDGVWTEARARMITRLPEPAASQLRKGIDDWSERWRAGVHTLCDQRTGVRLDLRSSACLERRLAGLDTLLGAIEIRPTDDSWSAGQWLATLDDPEVCLSPGVRSSDGSTAPELIAAQVAKLRQELLIARIGARERALAERIDEVDAIAEQAAKLGWRPLIIEVELVLGHLHRRIVRPDRALEHYGRALDLAESSGDLELIADAWSGLFRTEWEIGADSELGRADWMWRRERAALDRLGVSGSRGARLLTERGIWLQHHGRLDEAERTLREALAIFSRFGTPRSWEHATAARMLAATLGERGQHDEAAALLALARELELGSAVVEPSEVDGSALLTEGHAALRAADTELARERFEQALEAYERESGPRSLDVARARTALVAVHDRRGELTDARKHAELADDIYVQTLGPFHPRRSHALSGLGTVAFRERRFDDAARIFGLALEIDEAHLEPNSITLALHRLNFSEALVATGEPRRARPELELALSVLTAALPDDDLNVAIARKALGAAALALGENERARTELARAVEVLGQHEQHGPETAEALDLLARAEAALRADDPQKKQ